MLSIIKPLVGLVGTLAIFFFIGFKVAKVNRALHVAPFIFDDPVKQNTEKLYRQLLQIIAFLVWIIASLLFPYIIQNMNFF